MPRPMDYLAVKVLKVELPPDALTDQALEDDIQIMLNAALLDVFRKEVMEHGPHVKFNVKFIAMTELGTRLLATFLVEFY